MRDEERELYYREEGITGLTLRIIAMVSMLTDHSRILLFPRLLVLRYIGRLAFPIFAYLLVEGYSLTSNKRKYFGRLLLFALLSELPFNLMKSGQIFDPLHQNVLFTFCIAFGVMAAIETVSKIDNMVLTTAAVLGFTYLGGHVASELSTDYAQYGIYMVVLFYLFRCKRFQNLGQFLGMLILNFYIIPSAMIPIPARAPVFYLPSQSFAVLALIPIRMYTGERAREPSRLRYTLYAFYPLHMLILFGISKLVALN